MLLEKNPKDQKAESEVLQKRVELRRKLLDSADETLERRLGLIPDISLS